MSEVLETLAKLCLCAAIAAGCQPEIGDACHISDDCSQQGDRLCDTTQPGGYCTKFNCEPNSCPEEATCVAFTRASLQSSACDESPTALAGKRTFCLRRCKKRGDCRAGYECGDVGEQGNPWGASVVDEEGSGRVCIVPVQTVTVEGAEDAVCFGKGERATGGAGAGGTSTQPGTAGSGSDAGGSAGNGGGAGAATSGAGGGT
jgi:hypothetical protein